MALLSLLCVAVCTTGAIGLSRGDGLDAVTARRVVFARHRHVIGDRRSNGQTALTTQIDLPDQLTLQRNVEPVSLLYVDDGVSILRLVARHWALV